jgi:hypothetical protein
MDDLHVGGSSWQSFSEVLFQPIYSAQSRFHLLNHTSNQ